MIELLMVAGIISVLLAILLPSVNLARERARRTQCINNLKQIGLALMNYVTTYETLPPGSIRPSGSIGLRPDGDPLSWTVQLLPFMEQSRLAESLNVNMGPRHPVNDTVFNSRINTYLCPTSIPQHDSLPGLSSYAGCHHDIEAPIAADNQGVMFLNSSVRPADVGDGLSQTIFVGEMSIPDDAGWASGTRATLRNTGRPINSQDGPDSVPASFVGGFGSLHPGDGSNFVLGDGSVRFLRTTIDLDVYRRLGNRDDGEVIDDETAY
jgi:type II secretory pathway pseudopilin PulG